ncbi:hypothetical protein NHX12_015274 [Muraenolepis orangiensis]|uniref:Reverse transcriptase domain-containing protein n=2 Tax=Muraenolepis orangiensis TaxID=630683 RepID=A0A9Q0D9J7_9TELE|nr:hypothetical protein NHX12_015274 [Muraenolepis orangiensis]
MFEGIAKAGQPTRLNDFYIELLITEGDSGEVNKEHEVRLIEKASRKNAKEETPIKCEDIFKPLPGQDQPSRTIMMTGVAGIGKTVLTNKFTLDWAEGKANHDIHFIFPFTFRELNLLKGKEFSLVELLHHFFIEIKEAGICTFDQFQVVFILDGLDECRLPLDFQNNLIWTDVTESTSVDMLLTNLIRGDLLPSARIWITTRPAAANQIPAECVDMVTEPWPMDIKKAPELQLIAGAPNLLCESSNSQGKGTGGRNKPGRASSVDVDMSGQFTTAERRAAIGNLRQGKSPGHDNIHPEFVTHQSETTSAWLCSFFSSCFQRSKLPKTWRRAAVIALLKPGKTAEDPKAYRPISLLCVPFKILERMILSRIEPVVDPQLPREQAGFRRGRSTVDQVTLLTQDIEDSFQAKEKVGVVLLDLTAAYDTVWHRGLHLKLLRTIPDRHMVKFIMEMLSNRSFILRTSDGQRSRLRRLRNGVPQGSVLSPLLFNIYIHDLPETTSRQYGYADDLAIMLRRTTWSAVEQGLNQDMGILAAYLRKWRLQLSTGKTVSAAYHLCNREAKRELSVSVDNKRLEHQLAPKYLGVRLDRTLSYKRHLEEVRAKVTARVSLIRRLAGTTWGASARTLRISTQALVFSAAEYCAPVWSRSPHVKKRLEGDDVTKLATPRRRE